MGISGGEARPHLLSGVLDRQRWPLQTTDLLQTDHSNLITSSLCSLLLDTKQIVTHAHTVDNRMTLTFHFTK